MSEDWSSGLPLGSRRRDDPRSKYHGHAVPPRATVQSSIAGDVIGFALGHEAQTRGAVWITGDTVLYDGLRKVADRLLVDVALLHLVPCASR